MAEPFIGQLIKFGGNFAPRGYAFCNGQILSIAQNTALFALLGTTYGGNGQTTFALPDLQGRAAVHAGQGPGLSDYSLGQQGGSESVTLTSPELATHVHTGPLTPTGQGAINATTIKGTAAAPSAGALLARAVDGAASPTAIPRIYSPAGTTPTVALGGLNLAGTATTGITGNNQPHPNLSPYLAITFLIALQGVFPSRN